MFVAVSAFLIAAAQSGLLVSTADAAGLTDTLLVDARAADEFAAGHVPGALNVDVASLSETRGNVSGLLKPLDQVRKIMGDAGVDPAKRIVVYTSMESAGDMSSAARLFWVLEYLGYEKVALLDGGFAKWTAEGRARETGPSNAKPIALPEMKTRDDRLATAANVALAVRDHKTTLVDARSPEYFNGEKKSDVVKAAGHIPGAVNMSVDTCVSENKALKSWDELQSIAKSSGIDGTSPIISYCNTGRSGSTGYFVLRLLGYDNVAMYDGSMSEWTSTGTHPVEQSGTK